jgi:hypothetical protein
MGADQVKAGPKQQFADRENAIGVGGILSSGPQVG